MKKIITALGFVLMLVSTGVSAQTPEMVVYTVFSITEPSENSAIRANAGNFSIEFEVKPGLAKGHSIEVFMDGLRYRLVRRSQQGVMILINVDRGTHEIYGVIVDESDIEVARSEMVTVHLQRAAVGQISP